ncbi:glycosyltransferase family 2 protein [Microbulbifer halophilus]|uniref:Glycosyltransferase n=1 Tax=Microbulbifer halophilus TaxID=453963 RepID=A0ABW5EG27_9GAMM|nr:glycosyltransferase [Microbulbifer halophilus]MCW8127955.1 glycosyltransferase [Microbulbifer halophilus]
MSILKEANSLFLKGAYPEALRLYKQASLLYGSKVVEYNIELCEKAIGGSAGSVALASALDPISKILLSNDGEYPISPEERLACLGRYNELKKTQSEKAQVSSVDPLPLDWPEELTLAPLPEGPNDFLWHRSRKSTVNLSKKNVGISVIVPTYNRTRILDVTLACLVKQVTDYEYEVIVADDGSAEDLTPLIRKYERYLDIKFVRQRDYGYQLCAVRNLGLRTAKHDFVAILDCDMAPNPYWVQSYVELLLEDPDVALIGPRKYVDTHGISSDDIFNSEDFLSKLPEVVTNSEVGNSVKKGISVDWRLEHFRATENLRLCDAPFRFFSGGNVAFAKIWLDIAGYFDEEFTDWGGEDNEFGYRLYREGCFFRAVEGGLAYHQEPPGRENETDRSAGKAVTIEIVQEKVPFFYRKYEPITSATIKKVPLVSIYIPAFNCKKYIERCVNSALNQTVTDLEVCICDDGSTDGTFELINRLYGSNPRVQLITQENGGIGSASNSAVRNCRGYYVGQLDSDDYLEPDAVELCLKKFMDDQKLVCVYTTNRNVNPDGSLIQNGYNWPKYSREKLTTTMICHHFRMFTMRAWNLTSGFSEEIENAVDYDMYLKLSEVGPFKHINRICYNRVLHGDNTSIKKLAVQKENHFKVVNESLKRQNIDAWHYKPLTDDDACRKYVLDNSLFIEDQEVSQ